MKPKLTGIQFWQRTWAAPSPLACVVAATLLIPSLSPLSVSASDFDHVIAPYTFDDNVLDSIGNGHYGSVLQCSVTYTDGIVGCAGSFDGNDQVGLFESGTQFGAGNPISISLWFNTSSTNFQTAFAGRNPGSSPDVQAVINGISNVTEGAYADSIGTASDTYNNAEWDHVLRGVGSSEATAFAVDSVEQTSALSTGGSVQDLPTLGMTRTNDSGFTGLIDGAYIFEVLVTNEDIQLPFMAVASSLPEPLSVGLLGFGLIGFAAARRGAQALADC